MLRVYANCEGVLGETGGRGKKIYAGLDSGLLKVRKTGEGQSIEGDDGKFVLIQGNGEENWVNNAVGNIESGLRTNAKEEKITAKVHMIEYTKLNTERGKPSCDSA